ncbi:MAG: helix-turn-helix domain-containing protein [Fibrobacteres bacterium]|nr:helix-turn-helix domain-containing protein [Fibrobacterota bacterium]
MQNLRILIFLATVAFAGDTTLTIITDTSIQESPFLRIRKSDTATLFTSDNQTIYGEKSILLNAANGSAGLMASSTFRSECWLRFLLNLYLNTNTGPATNIDTLHFATLFFNSNRHNGQPSKLSIRIIKQPNSEQYKIEWSLRTTSNKEQWRLISSQIASNKIYCLEQKITFANDSLKVSAYIDNNAAGEISTGYYHQKEKWFLTLNNKNNTETSYNLYLDEFLISDKRVYGPPARITASQSSIIDFTPEFTIPEHVPAFNAEERKAVRWTLYSSDDLIFPLFDITERDPAYFKKKALPFQLDSGNYLWQVRVANQFGQWSDPSKHETLRIDTNRERFITVVKSIIETDNNTITPGKSYKLHIKIEPKFGWNDAAYVKLRFRHHSFKAGHPLLQSSNDSKGDFYINISFDDVDRPFAERLSLYERTDSLPTSHPVVLNGSPSSFIIGSNRNAVKLDTVNGDISLNIKLPENVLYGDYKLTTCAVNGAEKISNILESHYKVVPPSSHHSYRFIIIIASAIILASIAVLLILKRRNKSATNNLPDPQFSKVINYLNEHLGEELTVDQVRSHFKFAIHYFHGLLRKNGVESFPKLLNTLRVEKAKQLLFDPSKNISEISTELGFAEQRYFTKVFKDFTGLPPIDFRKKMQDRKNF